MLVEAGSNAGSRSAVRIIRGIALGTISQETQGQYTQRELKMAAALTLVLTGVGCVRVFLGATPIGEAEAVEISASLAVVTFTSVLVGASLPRLFERLGTDPAHAPTAIQIIIDISGVLIVCTISSFVLGGI
jgi:magnesium transporter